MRWPVFLLVAALAAMLAGCAASQQPAGQASSPPQENTTLAQNQSPPVPLPALPPVPIAPDLRLNLIDISANLALNAPVNVTVIAYNQGSMPSPATKTAYYFDGALAGTADLAPILSGETGNSVFSITCASEGNHTLRVALDYQNEGNESNLQNNAGTKEFSCSG